MSDEEVVELCLCEAHNVILRTDTLYRFRVQEGCESCRQYAEVYDEATEEVS